MSVDRKRHAVQLAVIGALAVGVLVAWESVPHRSMIGIGFLYAIPVGLTAWWYGRAAGLGAAAGALALYVVSASVADVENLVPSAVVRGVAYVAAALLLAQMHVHSRRLERTASELQTIRQALTPPHLPDIPGLDTAAALLPLEQEVAGDFYLLTNGPHGWSVAVVGDVVGHGPQAAELATFTRITLTSIIANCDDPADILRLTNHALHARAGRTGDFVTAVCVAYHPDEPVLRWAAAGHPTPVTLPAARELEPVRYSEPLGLSAELDVVPHKLMFGPADAIVLYTDGLYEARHDDELFGIERLLDAARAAAGRPAAEIVAALRQAVQQFADRPADDDICIVALRRRPAA